MMTRFVRCLIVACVVSTLGLAGCASWAKHQSSTVGFNYPHGRAETLTQSPHEHYQMMSRISAQNTRALIEDLDLLFLTERTTRLTRWHSK